MNQLALPDDVQFWSRQMSEHALFLSLLLQDPVLVNLFNDLHNDWEATIRQGSDVRPLLQTTIGFKEQVLGRLDRGEWLGWCLPSFLRHILMEARYFQSRLGPGTSTGQDVATFLQIALDHATIAPKLIDPAAPALSGAFDQARDRILGIQQYCSSGTNPAACLSAMNRELAADAAVVAGLPQNATIVHPALTAHIIRENQRGAEVARLLGGA